MVVQQGDLPFFLGAQGPLQPERMRWIHGLLAALCGAVVVVPEMRLKLAASPLCHGATGRADDRDPLARDLAQRPRDRSIRMCHGSAPLDLEARRARAVAAGGAAEDGSVATLMEWLGAGSDARPEDLTPFRLAAHIADDRTVAGLRFSTGSAHGALLGLALGLAFAARCGLAGPVPSLQASPAPEPAAFRPDGWREALAD